MEVKESNRLIAEFMGAIPEQRYSEILEVNQSGIHMCYPREGLFPDGKRFHPDSGIKYNTSWDWLMPVVERIQTILIEYDDEYCIEFYKDHLTGKPLTYISINWRGIKVEDENPIVANYKAVVEFIKWYNNEFKTD